MSYSILKNPQAERDIEECFVYIAEENLDVGIYFLVAVEDSIEQIADFPQIGSIKEVGNLQLYGLRMWRVKGYAKYLIFYLLKHETIEIIRVLHSSRDLQDLFD
jgi:toxin ParE1/3/4